MQKRSEKDVISRTVRKREADPGRSGFSVAEVFIDVYGSLVEMVFGQLRGNLAR